MGTHRDHPRGRQPRPAHHPRDRPRRLRHHRPPARLATSPTSSSTTSSTCETVTTPAWTTGLPRPPRPSCGSTGPCNRARGPRQGEGRRVGHRPRHHCRRAGRRDRDASRAAWRTTRPPRSGRRAHPRLRAGARPSGSRHAGAGHCGAEQPGDRQHAVLEHQLRQDLHPHHLPQDGCRDQGPGSSAVQHGFPTSSRPRRRTSTYPASSLAAPRCLPRRSSEEAQRPFLEPRLVRVRGRLLRRAPTTGTGCGSAD